jgi:hypothetical protein
MALSVTPRRVSVHGDQKVVYATVTFDNSYPTGGEELTVAMFGGVLQAIEWVSVPGANTAGNRLVVWDRANSKILLYTALGTQATNASDQSAIVVEVVVAGK